MTTKKPKIPLKPKATDNGVGTHKQSRQVLSTLSQVISSKNDERADLFIHPQFFEDLPQGLVTTNMTTRVARLVLELIMYISKPALAYYDEKNNTIVFDNLGQLSKTLEIPPDKLKKTMIALGSYQLPTFYTNGLNEMVEEYSSLFKVRFIYDQALQNKYGTSEIIEDGEPETIAKAKRIGTYEANYIPGETAKRIEIIPDERIIKSLSGESTWGGYITTTDNISLLTKGLDPIELKLFTYIGTKYKDFSAKAQKVIKDLTLVAQVKTQGKPRIIERLLKGLETMKSLKVIRSYDYDQEKEIFHWSQATEVYNYDGPRKNDKHPKS